MNVDFLIHNWACCQQFFHAKRRELSLSFAFQNAVMKRPIAPGDVFTPPFVKIMPPKVSFCFVSARSNWFTVSFLQGLPKRNSQQGSRGDQGMGGMQQQQPRREIKLMTSIARQERVEDPNVWKPKHAAKAKEDDPAKATEVMVRVTELSKRLVNELSGLL